MSIPTWLIAALALGLVGCETNWSPPAPAPFRAQPYGAGLDGASGGTRVDITAIGGELAARYRVTSSGIRIYAPDARQLGRVRPAREGWVLERVDGTVWCTLGPSADEVELKCGGPDVTVVADEGGWSIHVDERIAARVHRLDGEAGWGLTYVPATVPTVRCEDGRLSVQTHADARSWFDVGPATWHPAVLVTARLEIDGLDADSLALVRGALAFGLSRTLDATPIVVAPTAAAAN